MVKDRASGLSVVEIAAALDAGGTSAANNVVALLQVLADDARDEADLKTAIHALKLFFVDASQEGDLGVKRQRTNGLPSASPDAAAGAEDVYRQWLLRQYRAYTAALMRVLTRARASASLQVAAAVAVMEAVRCEQGVGVFASGIYGQLISALGTSGAVKPEVYTLLFTRYLHHADVRYFTLLAVRDCAAATVAAAAAAGGAGAGAAGAKTSSTKASAAKAAAAAAAATAAPAPAAASSQLPIADVARNLYDILSAVPERCAGAVGASEDATGSGELTSWVGLEEVGRLAAGSDKSESAKARRKRKAAEAVAAGGASKSARAAAAAEQRAGWANAKAQRRAFSEAWLALLQLPIPADICRKVLLRLHASVIPNMASPLMLSDFLTYSLNQGGIIGMLALNGIFVLVTQHGLEYPQFYDRLYQMTTRDAFAAKHRAQFFKLADLFLASGLVPAYTAAAFAKKMARLALSAPPAGAMTAIAFIHNLIRRHPSCMVLLDRVPSASAASGDDDSAAAASDAAGLDVFDEHEQDPAKCRAVESSLWEVTRLRNHYCPQVATLCSVLDKDLTDRPRTNEVDLDPILTTSYTSLFNAELARRLKQVPLAFYQRQPTKLFDSNCDADFGGWDFGGDAEQKLGTGAQSP